VTEHHPGRILDFRSTNILIPVLAPDSYCVYPELRRDRTARIRAGSRRQGAGWDGSGSQLIDRRWICQYDAWAEAIALT
jgi:hypothetical protein